MPGTKKDIIDQLQKKILQWQGFESPPAGTGDMVGLGPIEAAFPNGVFPVGSLHEFISTVPEQAAASAGFIAGILSSLMVHNGICLWIGSSRTLFPPALKAFGIEPDRVIFVDLHREKDILWVTEEALKCERIVAVITELKEINFTQSRRLQLAVEQSRVTGFILRSDPKKISATACVARWQITSLPSEFHNGMPGIGYPRWNVELLKVKNGNPGSYKVEWSENGFSPVYEMVLAEQERKAG